MAELTAPLLHADDFKGNTAAIQALIDQAARDGLGRVTVPPGVWTITTLQLRSNVTLRLARGAVLRAHHNLDDYPVFDVCKENHDRQPYHLLLMQDVENVTVEGDGTIDGQGPAFWDPPLPGSPWIRHRIKRPIHTLASSKIRVDGLTIRNHMFGPNNDGIDVTGCSDVLISNCDITGCDDNIIIKSMPDGPNCERIAVTNCILETSCACLGLGAESFGVIRDISLSNCVIRNSLRPIMVEMWDAGLVENVSFTNITGRCFTDVNPVRPIYLDVTSHRRQDGKLGTMRNVLISNVSMSTQGRCVMTAADGAFLENITLRDIHLRLEKVEDPHVSVPRSKSVQLSNDNPHTRAARAVVVADNLKRLSMHNVVTDWADKPAFPMHALWCRNVRGAVIDCPHLTPHNADALVQHDSELNIRALGSR
jgi:hypothetical protein